MMDLNNVILPEPDRSPSQSPEPIQTTKQTTSQAKSNNPQLNAMNNSNSNNSVSSFSSMYSSKLCDLTFSSKPIINALSMIAEEAVQTQAKTIVDTIYQRIQQVNNKYK
jgi:hypothetical protein